MEELRKEEERVKESADKECSQVQFWLKAAALIKQSGKKESAAELAYAMYVCARKWGVCWGTKFKPLLVINK